MPSMRRRTLPFLPRIRDKTAFNTYLGSKVTNLTSPTTSPLKPAELQVLRAQYEKEGDMVGIQTKFNYAWVCVLVLFFFPS